MKDPTATLKALDKLLAEGSLRNFIETFWPWVEPATPFVGGWTIDAICEHLEAVTHGQIKRLLMNVPPGFMKSLTTNVFWPAWEWGPQNMPSTRYVTASYSQGLTVRDNTRFLQVIQGDLYREFWGGNYKVTSPSVEKTQNDKTGWKLATSVGGIGTGERGDRVLIDDPNSVKEAESDPVRKSTNQWFTEVVPTRVNDPKKSAIIVIQQRTHEDDVSGVIMARELGYEHLMIPMEFDSGRICSTSIGWTDPRALDDETGEILDGDALARRDGELAWPERYTDEVLDDLKSTMGPYAVSGQFQQSPEPRGGGIFKRAWWMPWPPDDWPDLENARLKYPPMEYIVASFDGAFTEKEENDFCAMTVWGIWSMVGKSTAMRQLMSFDQTGNLRIEDDRMPKAMLMFGWQKRVALHGPPDSDGDRVASKYCLRCAANPGTLHLLTCPYYSEQRRDKWGAVEWTVDTCRRYKVDHLIIENKQSGISVSQELSVLYAKEPWTTETVEPKGSKTARAHSIQHLFSNGQIFAPMNASGLRTRWCEDIITQMQQFPRARHDDLVDSSVHALRHLRDRGLLLRTEEAEDALAEANKYKTKTGPLYEV